MAIATIVPIFFAYGRRNLFVSPCFELEHRILSIIYETRTPTVIPQLRVKIMSGQYGRKSIVAGLRLSFVAMLGSVAAMIGVTTAAHAANPGDPATDTFTVQITISSEARIADLEDVDFGSVSSFATSDQTALEVFTIQTNATSDNYTVTVTSDQGGFVLNDGGTNDIAYSIRYDDDSDASDGEALTYGTASSSYVSAGPTSTLNSSFHMTIPSAQLQQPAGTYSSVLTVSVDII